MIETSQNLSDKSLQMVSNTYDSVNGIRRFIKAMRKIAHSMLFPEKNSFLDFMEKHPITTKIYFASQVFTGIGLFLTIPKLKKLFKRIIHDSGLKRFDAATKAISTIGKALGTWTTIIAGLEAFKFGQILGKWGLVAAEKALAASIHLVDLIGVIGSILATASILHKSYKLYETDKIVKEIKSQSWYRPDGPYQSKEYFLFQQYCKQMSKSEAKSLSSALDLDHTVLKAVLVYQSVAENPSARDFHEMRHHVDSLIGYLELREKLCTVKILTSMINLISIACIFIPPLEPLAALIICATTIVKLGTLIFAHYKQYHFEKSMGIHLHEPSFADFIKWELGWHERDSRVERLVFAGATVGNGISKQLSCFNDILSGIKTAAKVISR